MEAKQEEEKEMQMALHCPPVYPLPEDIKKVGSNSKNMFLASETFWFWIQLYVNTKTLGEAIWNQLLAH